MNFIDRTGLIDQDMAMEEAAVEATGKTTTELLDEALPALKEEAKQSIVEAGAECGDSMSCEVGYGMLYSTVEVMAPESGVEVALGVAGNVYGPAVGKAAGKVIDMAVKKADEVLDTPIVKKAIEVLADETGAVGDVGELKKARTGRGKNKLAPDPKAQGPHSTFKTDVKGEVTGYSEWTLNPKNPSGFDEVKRVDIKGDPHFNKVTGEDIPTPHVKQKGIPGEIRPARPEEIPK